MAERVALRKRITGGGSYFAAPKGDMEFIPSGSKVLDLALGGGWAERRIANIVGDKSTGKTLLAIEACANFAKKYPKGKIRYREAESAFQKGYAGALGMPLDRVDFGKHQLETVEHMFDDISECINKAKEPQLYILDSLDALSDEAEMGRAFGENSYGTGKAKDMSKMFRMLVTPMADANMTAIIISQIRDKIGIVFGSKVTRTGGKALDFYASQAPWLKPLGRVKRRVRGVEHVTGVLVRAKLEKNKVSTPFKEAEMEISFGFGIDDIRSCLFWLKENKALKHVGLPATMSEKDIREHSIGVMRKPDKEYFYELHKIHDAVEKLWWDIETELLVPRKKY